MIASLKGVVQHLGTDHVVVEVAGVGYLVQVSSRTLNWLQNMPVSNVLRPGAPQPVFLFIETQVREDAITLYGFLTAAERNAFRRLNGVQGVGGRVALGIMGVLETADLARAILLQDKAMVARAPGVGPKLAQRIVTELKDRMADLAPDDAVHAPITPGPQAAASNDAVSALENLGFRQPEAMRAVAEAVRDLGGDLPAATLIREALKRANL